MTQVRAGVIGAGVFGGHHASKYAGHGDVALIGVHDPDEERARALAGRFDVAVYHDVAALIDAVDVLTIASPARTHGPLARQALLAGKHVLVEKPVAATVADAEAAVAIAEREGLVLQVGHQERFVFAAMGLLDVSERPRRVVARRLGPFSPRGSDVSVALDLMTHDIDLVRLLAGRVDAAAITAQATVARSHTHDRLAAEIRFVNGFQAELEASRLAEARDRVMRVEYDSGVVEVDFIAKTFVNTTTHTLNPDFLDDPKARDSLGAGVAAFVAAVCDGGPPLVSGADGLEAVRLALAADDAAERAAAPAGS